MLNHKWLAVLPGLVFAASALAQSAPAEMPGVGRQCLACHQVDAKRVGPPFRSVAQRYKDQSDALEYLTSKIHGGSQGVWGAVPMPAQSQLSQEDTQLMARWILSLGN